MGIINTELPFSTDQFSKINLESLNDATLHQRVDMKFLLSNSHMEALTHILAPDFDLLEINGISFFDYQTLYFDTSDLKCFHDAKIKKPYRYKIRKRIYTDNNIGFIEIKQTTKNNKTEKFRQASDTQYLLNENDHNFLSRQGVPQTSLLHQSQITHYKRLSFLAKDKSEKATLDFGIKIFHNDKSVLLNGLVVAELKKEGYSTQSKFWQAMRALGAEKRRVSKYTLGLVLLNDDISHQRYKTKISKLKSISDVIYG